jgi:hypothetical protein
LGQKQGREEVSALTQARGRELEVRTRPFEAVVAGTVIVGAIAVLFEVFEIVFLAIGHEISQSETVVGDDEVDARASASARPLIHLGAAAQAIGKLA